MNSVLALAARMRPTNPVGASLVFHRDAADRTAPPTGSGRLPVVVAGLARFGRASGQRLKLGIPAHRDSPEGGSTVRWQMLELQHVSL